MVRMRYERNENVLQPNVSGQQYCDCPSHNYPLCINSEISPWRQMILANKNFYLIPIIVGVLTNTQIVLNVSR